MPEQPDATTAERGPATQPMQHGHRPAAAEATPATLVPPEGWHVLHLFYRVNRAALARFQPAERHKGRGELFEALSPKSASRPEQMQCFVVPGHKADFGVVLAGTDLKQLHSLQMDVQACGLGPALELADSFYSLTEVSEYVPDVEQYSRILREQEGMDPESPAYKTKVEQYTRRLGAMNRQRLTPEFPDWPCLCFYPMSKMREGDQNWYLLPFETRNELMSQHGKTGMRFAGRVTQLITASTGLDNWEWGVTLWARNPAYLKEIVYGMRFDESSARYALFGPFVFGFIVPPVELIERVRL